MKSEEILINQIIENKLREISRLIRRNMLDDVESKWKEVLEMYKKHEDILTRDNFQDLDWVRYNIEKSRKASAEKEEAEDEKNHSFKDSLKVDQGQRIPEETSRIENIIENTEYIILDLKEGKRPERISERLIKPYNHRIVERFVGKDNKLLQEAISMSVNNDREIYVR